MSDYNAWIVFHWQKPLPEWGYKDDLVACVVGVFDNKQEADDACLDEKHYVFPMRMNEVITGDPMDYPAAYYPKAVSA